MSILTDVEACDKITVVFGVMPPYRYPRLETVGYGVQKEFVNEDIVSTKQAHDVDPLSRRAPKETMQFTVLDYAHQYDPDNPSGVWKYVAEKANISIQFGYEVNGNIEWIAPDNYTLDSKPSFSQNKATFKATGVVGSMSELYYKDTMGKKSFYDLAESVLRDADLMPLPDGRDPWVIHESLRNMETMAVMPIATHADCLQMIAHACCCELRTDSNNIIHIEPFVIGEATDFVVDFNTIAQNSQTMSKIDQLKSVAVSKYSWLPSPKEELFSETVDDTALHVEFGDAAKNVEVTIEGVTIDINGSNVEDSFIVENDEHFFDWEDTQLVNTNKELAFTTARTALTAKADVEVSFSYDISARGESELILKVAGENIMDDTGAYSGQLKAGETIELIVKNGTDGDARAVISSIKASYTATGAYSVYARAADLELSPGIKKVTITGMRVNREYSSVYTLNVNDTGSVDVEKNPLITDIKMCRALAHHVAAYLQKRNTYDVSYRGNPELECGDVIGLQTMYTDKINGLILTDEITFDGSLNGKIKVKML